MMEKHSVAAQVGHLDEFNADQLEEYDIRYGNQLLQLEEAILASLPPEQRHLMERYIDMTVREAQARADMYYGQGYAAGLREGYGRLQTLQTAVSLVQI